MYGGVAEGTGQKGKVYALWYIKIESLWQVCDQSLMGRYSLLYYLFLINKASRCLVLHSIEIFLKFKFFTSWTLWAWRVTYTSLFTNLAFFVFPSTGGPVIMFAGNSNWKTIYLSGARICLGAFDHIRKLFAQKMYTSYTCDILRVSYKSRVINGFTVDRCGERWSTK